MRLLLDTHIALWAILDDPRLATSARDLIIDATNDVQISAASVWEIAIKHALGRGHADAMPVSCREALGYFRQSGYRLLPITAEHAAAIADLPNLHRDPFDRMIVAQALTEPLRLLTHDRRLGAYSDTIMVA